MDLKVNQLINIPTKGFSRVISIGIVGILFAQPVFFFSIPGWTTRIGVASYLICLIAIIFDRSNLTNKITSPPKIYWWIIFSLCSFFLATLISQAANNTFVANRLDSPSRLLFATFIFWAVHRYKINFVKILKTGIPLSLCIFMLQIIIMSDKIEINKSSWDGRFSTPFMDPILLCAWVTCFGLICLNFIKANLKTSSAFKDFIFICGFVISVYIALLTESRTGLLATPIVITLLICASTKKWLRLLYLLMAACCILYLTSKIEATTTRFGIAMLEITSFINGGFKESSVGIRMEMGLLALKALCWKPLFGWGESLFTTPEIQVYLGSHFTPSTLHLGHYSGFHNDLYAASVRSGIIGILAYTSTFLTPLFLFFYLFLRGNTESKLTSLTGITVSITCIIASMTVEILAYKYSVTIFSYLIAGLMAQAVWKSQTS
jgi:O-antigen ligase